MSAVVAGLVVATFLPARAVDWPVFGFDPARSGFNSVEKTLTVGNVHRLRAKWQISLGSVADSTPIFIQHVRVGRFYRNMLFQTTRGGETFGIEASSGKILWHFLTHGPNYTHSTPVADPNGKAIYAPGVDGEVHKLKAATGHEIHANGFPAKITLIPATEANESPLNIANGYLYATISGYDGDGTPYDGHVVAINLGSGKRSVFNSLCSNKHRLLAGSGCSSQRSGIWARGGAVVDPDQSMNGRVYAATGNGDFNANQGGGVNYGDSVVALSADLSDLIGSYTPTNYQQLQSGDVDLGSTSPTVLPQQPNSQTPWMMTQGGKDSVLKLLNRAALSGVGNELQLLDLPAPLFSTPAVWTDGSSNTWLFMGFSDLVQAYRVETNGSGVSQIVGIWHASPGQTNGEGTSPVVANGIVFVAFDGAIVALNAINGNELWTSATHPKTIGSVHWQSPIVINGGLYCSDQSGNLTGFALQ
ncbi:MAG TPA: PQQ-binding-like beta-propeller repeat protein [Candidatus Cybelea sp.]|jgi:outer membrane protein assembly factor BamB|nr:PQQ-binding-like beta-propeller repeat protein [Candidatus Cybelea sp.]